MVEGEREDSAIETKSSLVGEAGGICAKVVQPGSLVKSTVLLPIVCFVTGIKLRKKISV
jgi:hypothetical protein